ncbi:sporulation histidine kinase inhibitor Sda [Halalkalibacter flavus]
MNQLKNELLVEVYIKAIEAGVDQEFLLLIKKEVNRRIKERQLYHNN